jgi:hypothetical protein
LEGEQFTYVANDRLRLPNTDEAFAALKPDLEAAAQSLYSGAPVTITRVANDPRDRLSAMVETQGTVDLSTLV